MCIFHTPESVNFATMRNTFFYFIAFFSALGCVSQPQQNQSLPDTWKPGAHNTEEYLPLLRNKKVGVVAHHCSRIDQTHLIDSLLSLVIDIPIIFAPEHGFRGKEDAGDTIKNGIDSKTGIPIVSLYGKQKKPRRKDLENIDVMVFDLQDVGARFYTYISTLAGVIDACAETQIPLIVLDRPNPNSHRVGGPVLRPKFKSFVGAMPIPILYGLTIGELAKMYNKEWATSPAELRVVYAKGFQRGEVFALSPPPSPNLRSVNALMLYPSLCFFEGTTVSAGRGSDTPFELYGHPLLKGDTSWTPRAMEGAQYPKFKNKRISGKKLNYVQEPGINYRYVMHAYQSLAPLDPKFFNSFFKNLAGTDSLQIQLENYWSVDEIQRYYQAEIDTYKKLRKKYIHYPSISPAP